MIPIRHLSDDSANLAAKLNGDWLFAAQPLRIWLHARTTTPYIGGLFDYAWVAYAMSWAGAAFDLTIPFWLSWPPATLRLSLSSWLVDWGTSR